MQSIKRKSCQQSLIIGTIMLLFGFFSLFSPSNSRAESHLELMQLAQGYILTHLDPQLKQPQVRITPLSVAAKKPNCETPPQINFNTKQQVGNVSLTISCTSPQWRQYVNAKVTGLLPVVVAIQDLMAGQALDASMLAMSWRLNSQVTPNHLRQLDGLEHKAMRQFIAKGTALQHNHLTNRTLIHKNDLVNIVSADPRFRIEMKGIALESGSLGQAIRVKNQSSNKIIKAYIESADTVSVR